MHIERLFTTGSLRPQDSMRFVLAGSAVDMPEPVLAVPDEWSLEAAESFREALCLNAPALRRAVEENTTPSWLWQRRAQDETTCPETSVLDVIDRIAGAATYRGWKLGLWDNEVTASIFYDETHALLLTRRLILAPQDMARLGVTWAYGIEPTKHANAQTPTQHTAGLILQNDTIDAILRRTQPLARTKWMRFLEDSQTKPTTHIAFADTVSQWGVLPKSHNTPRAMLNLLAFRTHDGSLDIAGLKHATSLAVLLLDLHYQEMTNGADKDRALALGIGNLASLLMSLAIPYDSDEACGTAASLAAIISATATSTSAQMAAKLGTFTSFTASRETCLRALRNKLRASFDEKNDYDHLSILPHTLRIDSGTDLVLISMARHACEEALRLTQEHGLRHAQLTSLFPAPDMLALMDASGSGIEAEGALTCDYAVSDEQFQRQARPALSIGLEKLGYDEDDIKAIIDHVVGYHTLVAAPAINHALLRDKGLDEATLRRIESVLPFVEHLRHAFTPWVIGADVCRTTLGLCEEDLLQPHLDILARLGFSSQEIAVANAFCCGHRSVGGVAELNPEHVAIFETRDQVSADAQVKMASSVQSFINGDVSLTVEVPANLSAEMRSDIVLKAWEMGLKGITLHMDAPYKQPQTAQTDTQLMKRKTPSLSRHKDTPSVTSLQARALKPKAPARSVSLKRTTSKATGRTKRG